MKDANWELLLGKIRGELSNLAEFVDDTMHNLDTLVHTVKVGSEKFPEASDQLQTVTGDLESAANNIMTLLESLIDENEKAGGLISELKTVTGKLEGADAEKAAKLVEELDGMNSDSKDSMMEMFSHMSFHDLSGQKLKKVMTSLGQVETKLKTLAEKFGVPLTTVDKKAVGDETEAAESLDQDVVDKLLAELGG